MNTDLLLRVKKRILEEPQSLDMRLWQTKRERRLCGIQLCGTVACVAGHVILESGRYVPQEMPNNGVISDAASQLLGISGDEGSELFHFHNPEASRMEEDPYGHLRNELLLERIGTQGYADVVARAIDLCIARNADLKPTKKDSEFLDSIGVSMRK